MEIEISTREVDVELLPVVGDRQVHVEDGMTAGCQRDVGARIGRVFSHGLNRKGHGFVHKHVGLRSRGDFQFSSSHC